MHYQFGNEIDNSSLDDYTCYMHYWNHSSNINLPEYRVELNSAICRYLTTNKEISKLTSGVGSFAFCKYCCTERFIYHGICVLLRNSYSKLNYLTRIPFLCLPLDFSAKWNIQLHNARHCDGSKFFFLEQTSFTLFLKNLFNLIYLS